MTYEFIVDGETFNGRTHVGSARVHVYQPAQNRVIAWFDPIHSSLFSKRPNGAWAYIHEDISLSFLEKLQPHLVNVCRQRIINHYS
ncbi:hypothetical protein [Paenalcaligenes faecalis]|uniref:hypothetical protein n=1 Tax=Paenalcaligenes faecalis TaxID=2980099 RepID=UPI0022B9ABD8|nr:hypothetical protein [Paenalcaligenes faecalis]